MRKKQRAILARRLIVYAYLVLGLWAIVFSSQIIFGSRILEELFGVPDEVAILLLPLLAALLIAVSFYARLYRARD